jgi:predicted membrane-bound mannosyltransferase
MLDDAGTVFRAVAAVATLVLIVINSAMPYKTPWVVLTALLGLIIMAGSGIESFLTGADRMRPVRLVLLAGIMLHLGWEAYAASFMLADDPGNPYVYAQPRQDVVEIGKAVTALARASDKPINVCVCYQDGEYWPMPWYLRTVTHTGWWTAVPDSLPRADVVLVSPELEPALTRALYERATPGERQLYVPVFTKPLFVRPGREIRAYATLALREQWQRKEQK